MEYGIDRDIYLDYSVYHHEGELCNSGDSCQSAYKDEATALGVDETSHEGSRQDGRDAEQCCCQTYGHDISAQRGDKKGERGQQCMKVNENEEINQTYLDERADP